MKDTHLSQIWDKSQQDSSAFDNMDPEGITTAQLHK